MDMAQDKTGRPLCHGYERFWNGPGGLGLLARPGCWLRPKLHRVVLSAGLAVGSRSPGWVSQAWALSVETRLRLSCAMDDG